MTVLDLIEQRSREQPSHIAMYDGEVEMTYSSMIAEVDALCILLQENGVRPGMGIGVMGGNSSAFVCHALAVLKCGAVVLPVSSQLKYDELDRLCRSTHLHYLWDDRGAGLPPEWTGEINHEGQWRLTKSPYATAGDELVTHISDAALIRFTSGTTGTAKGVIISHEGIIERLAAANRKLELGPQDTVIWVLSMAYHFVVSILLYLRYGCSICICQEFLADVILDDIGKHEGTFLYVSPMHIRMLAADQSGRLMPSVRTVISTSTGISATECRKFYDRYGIPVSQAYGIIEIGLPILNDTESVGSPDSVGYALPDYTVDILDDDANPLPVGETGHLAIRGPGMFAAYLDPPILSSEVLQNGYFLTGDLAVKRDDGLIRIAGRKKSMINVSGNKVFPEEVEDILNGHPSVKRSRISGFAHPILMEGVRAEVVLQEGAEVDIEELITYCRRRLSMYKVPQRIEFVASLPMTDSGKLIRH